MAEADATEARKAGRMGNVPSAPPNTLMGGCRWQGPVAPGTIETNIRLLARPWRIAMRTHAPIVMVVGMLIAADAPKDDLHKLQGTWSLVSAVRDGKDVPDDEVNLTTLVIHGNTFTFPEDARVATGPSGTFTIDPSRTPRAIGATPSSGPNKGETWLGIYEVMGDLYKVAFAPPGKARPTRYVSEPGSGQLHSVWRRGTPADALREDLARADMEKLQGPWRIASVIVDGREVEGLQFKEARLAFQGNEYVSNIGEQVLKVRIQAGTRAARRRPSISLTRMNPPRTGRSRGSPRWTATPSRSAGRRAPRGRGRPGSPPPPIRSRS